MGSSHGHAREHLRYLLVNASETRDWLLGGLVKGEPRRFVKFGDGEYLCMSGAEGQTCDGQPYSRDLDFALRVALYAATRPDLPGVMRFKARLPSPPPSPALIACPTRSNVLRWSPLIAVSNSLVGGAAGAAGAGAGPTARQPGIAGAAGVSAARTGFQPGIAGASSIVITVPVRR